MRGKGSTIPLKSVYLLIFARIRGITRTAKIYHSSHWWTHSREKSKGRDKSQQISSSTADRGNGSNFVRGGKAKNRCLINNTNKLSNAWIERRRYVSHSCQHILAGRENCFIFNSSRIFTSPPSTWFSPVSHSINHRLFLRMLIPELKSTLQFLRLPNISVVKLRYPLPQFAMLPFFRKPI